jgi:hypothetical protein
MSKLSKKMPSVLRNILIFTAFLCCLHVPALAQGVNGQGDSPFVDYYNPQPYVQVDGGEKVFSDNYGRTPGGGCIFENGNQELYDKWGNGVSSDVEAQPAGTVADPMWKVEKRVATREPENLFGTKGCPIFTYPDNPDREPTYLKACEGFFRNVVGPLNATDEASNEGALQLPDVDPAIACCAERMPDARLACFKKTRAGQAMVKAAAHATGTKANVLVEGMPPEKVKKVEEKKKEDRNAIQQCWDKKLESVNKYFKAKKVASCIAAVKDYFSKEAKDLRKAAVDKAATDTTMNASDIGHLTAGTSAGPGNVPAKGVASVVLALKGSAKTAVIAVQIAQALNTMLNKCAMIATNYDSLEQLVKSISNQLCEATLGLLERQLTQCIRVNFGGSLQLPRFNLLTQCPFNFNLDLRLSPSGINCTMSASGQSALVGGGISGANGLGFTNDSANFQGGNGSSFLNAAGDVEEFFRDRGCLRSATVRNGQGGIVSANGATGALNNPPSMSMPRVGGVDCGPLNTSANGTPVPNNVIFGIQYLPPGPAPTTGEGWVVGPVHDTGFPSIVPAFANQVSRCDYYAQGRIKRTAYVFGDGSLCTNGVNGFLSGGKEIMTSCYPEGGYKPIEKSPTPEACMYRQGTPTQPCLFEDLSGLDPAKATNLGTGASVLNTNDPISGNIATGYAPTSITVSLTNNGQLMSTVDQVAQNTVLDSGYVLSRGSVLTTQPLTNFTEYRQPSRIGFGASGGLTGTGGSGSGVNTADEVIPGDIIELATDQTGCARGFATHDSVGSAAIPRRYPLATPITNADGSQQWAGFCSDFSTAMADLTCCDPQSQNCSKPPYSSAPICACDQGDKLTKLIPAKDDKNTPDPADDELLYEPMRDELGQPVLMSDGSGRAVNDTTKPKYVCVDKNNKLISGASMTCCDAKANGEGATGCGSPLGVPVNGSNPGVDGQSIIGAIQLRAKDQVEGFDWESAARPDLKLKRCADEVAMCVPEASTAGQNIVKAKNSPYKYLIVRPNKTIVALNGIKAQCCSSKWCNVCPQAYAGAYGLVQRENTTTGEPNSVYTYEGYRASRGDQYPGIADQPDFDASTPFKSTDDMRGTGDEWRIWAEKNWNMGLFRDGWPFQLLKFMQNDNQWWEADRYPDRTIWHTGYSAYAPYMATTGYGRIYGLVAGNDNPYAREPFAQNNDFNKDYRGVNCGRSRDGAGIVSENPGIGQPCAFPGFVIAQQARPDRETEEECADAARYEYSSWQDLKNRLNANNYAGTGLLGKTVRAFFRHPVHSPETIYKIMMHDGGMSDYSPEVLGGGWPWWGYEWANLGHANRFMDSVAGSPTGMASMKFGNTEWSSVPEPQIYPIDYLNLMKAKMTPPGEEFKEIKLCSEAFPICTDPKLNQYGNSNGNGGDETGGVGANGGSPWDDGSGDGDGDGMNNGGNGNSGGAIPPQCIGLTGDALAQCIATWGGGGGGGIPSTCAGITDPMELLACLAANGFGDGTIPAECVGLPPAEMLQCILNHFGGTGNGGMGAGGVREGGLTGGGSPFGGANGDGGGGMTGGGTDGGPVRPHTGSGTGVPTPGNTGGGSVPTLPGAPTTGGTLTPPTGGGTGGGPLTGGTSTEGTTPGEGLF